ncbi:MAG: hypothetical protein HY659_06710, partial [Rhizobiales bacterium]|nr:hypothetical protein [Hyphomicrobiales bacterium]
LTTPARIDGRIEIDSVDISAAIAAVAGMPASPPGEAGPWPNAPFHPSFFPDLSGSIDISSARAALTPSLVASNLNGRLRFAKSEIVLEGIEGGISGGRFNGTLILRKEGEGISARTAITLTGADAALVVVGGQRPPIAGRIGLQLELDGTGPSPRALIGSLGGTGSVSLEGAQIAGLDPKAFAAATKMADQGLAVDLAKVRDIVAPALASGSLAVAHAETAITVAAGQARLSTIVARGEGADITVNGGFDLTQGTVDARILLSGPKASSVTPGHPEIAIALKGPYSAPIVSHDVSALVSWLALRSVDQQSKKLREIEAERRKPERTGAPSAAPALPPPIEILPAPGRKSQSRSDNTPTQTGRPHAAVESPRPADIAR